MNAIVSACAALVNTPSGSDPLIGLPWDGCAPAKALNMGGIEP